MVRIAYFPLGDYFASEYCSNIGVREIICCFILRQTIDLIFFTGHHLAEISPAFQTLINELNEPNLPRVSLTPNRGSWLTLVGSSTPTPNQSPGEISESEKLIPNGISNEKTAFVSAYNSETISMEMAENLMKLSLLDQSENVYTISFDKAVQPDILVTPKNPRNSPASNFHVKGYSDSGAVKLRSDHKFTTVQKFETNPENLRSEFIPYSWETNQRISKIKPQFLEIQFY